MYYFGSLAKSVREPTRYPMHLSDNSSGELSPLSHRCLFFCYFFLLDFYTHITFHVDGREPRLTSGALSLRFSNAYCRLRAHCLTFHCQLIAQA